MSSQAASKVTEAIEPPAMSIRRLAVMFATVSLPVVVIDQLTKYIVSTTFQMYQTRPVIPGWLDLTYTENPGAAFSLFATMPEGFRHVFFVGLSFGAIAALSLLMARRHTTTSAAIGFAAVLGGTIGNLIDRLGRGRVVDFIYFHHSWFSYPVFNIADSAITLGVAWILIVSLWDRSEAA